MDIKSAEERSRNMARIKSSNTRPELYLRSLLHNAGFRFRVNVKEVEGNPDIYFSRKKVAVFIHGCYWHRHQGCRYAYTPKTNIDFWIHKFENNQKRDGIVQTLLQEQNIRVLVVWECTIKKMEKDKGVRESELYKIASFINESTISFLEV